MPRNTKCWYNNCDSNNGHESNLLFYKFPKDLDRCEKWVRNCANQELTKIWNESPDKVATFRICQKHFLPEFLGSSSRLVGHAVPAPYGVVMDRLDAEMFMVDCASLRSSSSLVKQSDVRELDPRLSMQSYPQEQQYSLPYYDNSYDQSSIANLYPNCDISNSNYNQYYSESVAANSYSQGTVYEQQPATYLSTIDPTSHQTSNDINQNAACQLSGAYSTASNHTLTDVDQVPSNNNLYATNYEQDTQNNPVTTGDELLVTSQPQTNGFRYDDSQQQEQTSITAPPISKFNHQENPKINYDREGKVISVQYSSQTMSLLRTDNEDQDHAHIEALKHKVRYYQRKLAVKNHRYQKLKSQTKARSNKTRLLESLRTCKADFSPCIFEIFERQIKGPSSKHGNRWSDDVKSFSSAIYLRSSCAYRFIRKSIELPSESIVKRYIAENNPSRLLASELDDEADQESERKSD